MARPRLHRTGFDAERQVTAEHDAEKETGRLCRNGKAEAVLTWYPPLPNIAGTVCEIGNVHKLAHRGRRTETMDANIKAHPGSLPNISVVGKAAPHGARWQRGQIRQIASRNA